MTRTDLQSRDDLLAALANAQASEADFWRRIDAARFARPLGEAWSPADNVRHLIKSTVPVARALRLPKVALRLLFGPGRSPSLAYAELVARYRDILAAGGKAGRFAPAPRRPPEDLDSWQGSLVTELRDALGALARALGSWREGDLDRCRLPHPLLGKLTVREMILFTLYHCEHHRAGVTRRLSLADPAA